jgi:hypothetical protein
MTLALVPAATTASAQTSVHDFDLGGSAQIASEDCIRLTPDAPYRSGSAWFREPVDSSRPFEVHLSLVLGDKDAAGADGIAFVLHPGKQTGWRGEGMGFTGLSPSLAVEFDTYQNRHLADPVQDHVAVMVNGDPLHARPNAVRLGNLEDGRRHPLHIEWRPSDGVLRIRLDGADRISVPAETLRLLFGQEAILHWGMTAATGRSSNDQLICVEELLLSWVTP